MASIRKTRNGKYEIRVYMGRDSAGKKIFSYHTCATKREANAKAAELEYAKKDREASGLKVSEAISAYIESRTNILSPTTIKSYRQYLNQKYKDIIDMKIMNRTNGVMASALPSMMAISRRLGNGIKQGIASTVNGASSYVSAEMNDIHNAITSSANKIWDSAKNVASGIVSDK